MVTKIKSAKNYSVREGVLVDTDNDYSLALKQGLEIANQRWKRPRYLSGEKARDRIRSSLIEDDQSDPFGHERLIGKSDFVSINFLSRGLEAAKAVCRVRVPGPGGGWYGTGFLAAPGLLVTNNHVLASHENANQAEAEFSYEHDLDGVIQPPIQFNLAPDRIFFTDIDHDITLVAVVDHSDGGVPLDTYGYLPLLPLSGKGRDGEWVTIVQHPRGEPKQMTIRANQIFELDDKTAKTIDTDRFIHYRIDTQPGSSGAPVLNDQWQVVAVHHKAIPVPGDESRRRLERDEEPEWLANEGIRISAITNLLERKRFSDRDAARAVDVLERSMGLPSTLAGEPTEPANPDATSERDPRPHKTEKWTGWTAKYPHGYNPEFLSSANKLTIAEILGGQQNMAAPLLDDSGYILDYIHFSTVIHKERKFPLLTAVNIDGGSVVHPGKRSGKFMIDARMHEIFQPAANFYEKKQGNDPVQFSRGHLVRRFDPCWGLEKAGARIADSHTFHYSNAAPQVQGFNGGIWLDIEDYVLNRAQLNEKRMSVFTGPVFRDQDPEYGHQRTDGPWQIPTTYWKIVAVRKGPTIIAATAFMTGQTKYIKKLFESRVFANLRQGRLPKLQSRDIQVPISVVEEETGLNFSALHKYDIASALESTRQNRFLQSVSDIII